MARLLIYVALLSLLQACDHGGPEGGPGGGGFTSVAQSPVLLLDATFEGKDVNAPIGTGGAAAGEPRAVAPSPDAAFVRDEPMPTRCL